MLEDTREQGSARESQQEKKLNEIYQELMHEQEQTRNLELEKERLTSDL